MDDKDLRRPIEGWTLDALADHLLGVVSSLLAEVDKRYEQRFKLQDKATELAISSLKEQIQMALISAKEAVTKAEVAVEKRFDNTNEWRGAMQDRDRNQMPRPEIEKQFDSLKDQRTWAIGIIISIILGLASLIISLKH
jgi:hypothetical protein